VPSKPEKGTHKISFGDTLVIQRSDFREVDEPDFFGLALKTLDAAPKIVKLKYVSIDIKVVDVAKDSTGKITELIAEIVHDAKEVKHAIHWIAVVKGKEPIEVDIRNYEHLFLSEEPANLSADWLNDINPNSLTSTTALVDPSVADLKVLDRVQFERVGYYCVDQDSRKDRFVFNRTMPLKESSWKKHQTAGKK